MENWFVRLIVVCGGSRSAARYFNSDSANQIDAEPLVFRNTCINGADAPQGLVECAAALQSELHR